MHVEGAVGGSRFFCLRIVDAVKAVYEFHARHSVFTNAGYAVWSQSENDRQIELMANPNLHLVGLNGNKFDQNFTTITIKTTKLSTTMQPNNNNFEHSN
jgi:hypothetical protein